MRQIVFIILLLISFIGVASLSFAESKDYNLLLQLNNNHGSWNTDSLQVDGGEQNGFNSSVSVLKEGYGFSLLNTFAKTNYQYADGSGFNLSDLGDTIFSGYFRLWKKIRLGVDLNIPTGHAAMSEKEYHAAFLDTVSQDLNLIGSFGKGYDFAPNFVVTQVLFERFITAFALRYQVNGTYNPTLEIKADDYTPGKELTLMGSLQYVYSKKTLFFLDLSSVLTARDKQNGEDVYKRGTSYDLGVRLLTESFQGINTVYGVYYGVQDKNQSISSGAITTENRNSNNNRYEFVFNVLYNPSDILNLNAVAGYKNVMSNGYDRLDVLYDAGYSKMYWGCGFSWRFEKDLTASFDVKGFQIENKQDSMETNNSKYSGINIDLGIAYSY